MYLSTILDDYSRYIIAWKLCTTMKTSDVTDTLNLALQASGCDQAHVAHKPQLLSDNGSSYVPGELAEGLEDKKMGHVNEKGSNGKQWNPGACNTANTPLNIINQMSQILL
jgi:transposase InsO family protein